MENDIKSSDNLEAQLEALLLVSGDVVQINRLSSLLDCSKDEAQAALSNLNASMLGRENSGIVLVQTGTSVALSTSPAVTEKLKAIQQKSIERDIGTAGLEILSVLLYLGPATRSRIDYIRGVNSSSTIRNLLMRQLIERVKNPKDKREYVYKPTVELLAHLGVTNVSELPEFEEIKSAISKFTDDEPQPEKEEKIEYE